MFKKDVFPGLLLDLMKTLLDPNTINKLVLSSMESARDSLQKNIVLENEKTKSADDQPLDELDEASGELILEVLNATTMPDWMKKLLILDSKGEISPAMKKSLGASMRKQFHDQFIKETLEKALESLVKRDEEGKPFFDFDPNPKPPKPASEIQNHLKTVSRELIDASISNAIKTKWMKAQARFDELVEKAFGKIGTHLKHALDSIFRFIFFKIVGSALELFLWPTRQLAKQVIYRVLDRNRDALLGILSHSPEDRPHDKHIVYHEDLIYKMGRALNENVQEFFDKEPVLP